jgi:lysyl-tRNA synthetase, class I
MRWAALGVDYEMYGKDLIPSTRISARSSAGCSGGRPPELYIYELFLDENGQKISKSRGNGLTMEDWLTYASPRACPLHVPKPKTAKRLYFDVIPKAMDEYHAASAGLPRAGRRGAAGNPAWHIHGGAPPVSDMVVPFRCC